MYPIKYLTHRLRELRQLVKFQTYVIKMIEVICRTIRLVILNPSVLFVLEK